MIGRLYYVDDEFNLDSKAIKFEVSEDGKYLIGTLEHLSPYVLVGDEKVEDEKTSETNTPTTISNDTKEETTTKDDKNPKTNDNVMTYVAISLIGVVEIAGTIVVSKKKKSN